MRAGQESSSVPTDVASAPADVAIDRRAGRRSAGNVRRAHRPPAGAAPEAPVEIPVARAAKVVQGAKLIPSTRPVYPPLAKQSNTQGRVIININIDDKGNVIAANAVSGPIPLRQAALRP